MRAQTYILLVAIVIGAMFFNVISRSRLIDSALRKSFFKYQNLHISEKSSTFASNF